jgi:hypothetical protein
MPPPLCLPCNAAAAVPMAAPLTHQEVTQLVCDLGKSSEPATQKKAVESIIMRRTLSDDTTLRAIAAAGAIPPLVHLLGPSSAAGAQAEAAYALKFLNFSAADKTALAAACVGAGAVFPLVQLLASDMLADIVKEAASVALLSLIVGGNSETATTIVAAGAIPALVELLQPGSSAMLLQSAIGVLLGLAQDSGNAADIARTGAIIALKLDHIRSDNNVHQNAMALLDFLSVKGFT